MICHKNKLIFVHVSKNAGTSISHYFGGPDIHLIDKNWKDYKNYYREYWNEYKTFSVIRNPISRIISSYKYCRMNDLNFYGINHLNKKSSIDQFADVVYKNFNIIETSILKSQSWFICENNKIMVDVIIKYENLCGDLKKIKIDSIPHLNVSKIEDESFLNLSKTSLDILHELYREDFKLL